MAARRNSASGRSGVASKPHHMVAYGAGGLAEMLQNILADDCCFCLLKVIVGSGTLARAKTVFFVWTGPDVSAIKRSKVLNAKSERLEDIHGASLDFNADSYDDISAEAILDHLKRHVTIDDGDVELHVDVFKVAPPPPVVLPVPVKHEKTIAEEKSPAAAPVGRQRNGGEFKTIMGLVRQEVGGLNWMIAEGGSATSLHVVDSGKSGIVEMIDAIKDGGDDKMYVGLVQLVIGEGAGRKVKFGFIVWSGHACGAVKKGKFAQTASDAENASLFGSTHFSVHANSAEELSTEVVIDKLRHSCVEDKLDYEISFESIAHMQVLEEAAPPPAPAAVEVVTEKTTTGHGGGLVPGSPEYVKATRSKYTRAFKDVLDEIKDQAGVLNWAMFQ